MPAAPSMAPATRSARPVGTRSARRARSGAPSRRRCGNGATATPTTSPLRRGLLQRRQRDRPEELDLVLKLDAELLQRAPPGLLHQRQRVGRAGTARVLDEVRVAWRDLGASDAVALQAAGLQHPACGELVVRVLEDAPEGALARRLGRLALRLHPGDRRANLVRGPRHEPELRARNDLAVAELRVPVAEPELLGPLPRGAVAVDHERAGEDLRPVAAVGARVHPDAAADGARDGARELEPAEPRRARPVQADGVRGAATRDEYVA